MLVAKRWQLIYQRILRYRGVGPGKRRGLLFVGIDVIGYLTELCPSPTGIREFERFTGISLAAKTWMR